MYVDCIYMLNEVPLSAPVICLVILIQRLSTSVLLQEKQDRCKLDYLILQLL